MLIGYSYRFTVQKNLYILSPKLSPLSSMGLLQFNHLGSFAVGCRGFRSAMSYTMHAAILGNEGSEITDFEAFVPSCLYEVRGALDHHVALSHTIKYCVQSIVRYLKIHSLLLCLSHPRRDGLLLSP